MNIQWYPGHMTRAKRNMQNDVKLVDLVVDKAKEVYAQREGSWKLVTFSFTALVY